jgi:23S rRNA pseudouridine1911/1915/1917 synthase
VSKKSPLKFTIFFEDAHLIVLSKPSGLLSQGEVQEQENLVDELRVYLGRHFVGLVHRLDRNTSGLMVVAKRSKSAQRLTASLQKGDLRRSYLAWLHGHFKAPLRLEGTLKKNEATNLSEVVRGGTPGGKLCALTLSPVLLASWQDQPVTLAEFELETGRSHQIRVQSSHRGFPVLGDLKYGNRDGMSRLALHSHQISFPHPMSGEVLSYVDPLPDELDQRHFCKITPLR